MANSSTLDHMARAGDDPTTRRLRELAAQEAAATKERLATRTAAARSFSAAVARLGDAKAAWEGVQAEAQRLRAKAVEDLLSSGMHAGEVTGLLGISERELRALRATTPKRPRKGDDATDGAAPEAERRAS